MKNVFPRDALGYTGHLNILEFLPHSFLIFTTSLITIGTATCRVGSTFRVLVLFVTTEVNAKTRECVLHHRPAEIESTLVCQIDVGP